MIKLAIDQSKIDEARNYAKSIVDSLKWLLDGYTSETIERTIVRLLGIDGAIDETPIPNLVVEHLKEKNILDKGAAYWISNSMLATNLSAQEVAEKISNGKLDVTSLNAKPNDKIIKLVDELTDKMLSHIKKQKNFSNR